MNGVLNFNRPEKSTTNFKSMVLLFLLTCGLSTIGQSAFSQTVVENAKAKHADAVQTSATFPGGMEGFYNYIHSNLKPDSTCWPGRKVYVRFMVDKTGAVKHAQIRSKMLSRKMTAQLVKVFEQAPKWTPAQQNGLAVREHFICPVMFTPQTELVAQVK